MQFYKLIPRKDLIKAITDIIDNKDIENRFLFLKLTLAIKAHDFTPAKFQEINWYGGSSEQDLQLIFETNPEQIRFFQKKGEKIFVEVDAAAEETGIYSIFPFNFIDKDYLKKILLILQEQTYKNIYLVTKYKKPDLNLSLNTSLNYGSGSFINPTVSLAKKLLEQETIYENKLEKLKDYIDKKEFEFKQDTEKLTENLLNDKIEAVTLLQNEVNTQKNLVSAKQNEIDNFNVRVSDLTKQLSQANTEKLSLQNQLNTATSNYNHYYNAYNQLLKSSQGIKLNITNTHTHNITFGSINKDIIVIDGVKITPESGSFTINNLTI